MALREKFILADFPAEIIGIICERILGNDICRLRLVGSRALDIKIRSPFGAQKLVITPYYARSMCSLELLRAFGGLKTLKIKADPKLDYFAWINPHALEALPPTLNSILFCFSNAESCWIKEHACSAPSQLDLVLESILDDLVDRGTSSNGYSDEDYDEDYDEEDEDDEEVSQCDCAPEASCFDFQRLLPNLTSLVLQCFRPDTRTLRGRHLELLPPSLTELELPSPFLRLQLLPPNTQVLILPALTEWDAEDATAVSHLPLRSLSISTIATSDTPCAEGLFPAGLESLSIQECSYDPMSSLPPGLPKGLTRFMWHSNRVVTQEEIISLPQTLTHLHLGAIESPSRGIPLLPKGLKSLTIGYAQYYEHDDPPAFPASLTELELGFDPFVSTAPAQIPHSITKLKCTWTNVERFVPLSASHLPWVPPPVPNKPITLPENVLINDSPHHRWFRVPKAMANEMGHLLPVSEFQGFVSALEAIYTGNITLLNWMKATGYDWMPNFRAFAPLHIAFDCGHLNIVKWLLREGVHPSLRNNSGRCILGWLIGHGKVLQLKWLISEFPAFRRIFLCYFGFSLYDVTAANFFTAILQSGSIEVLDYIYQSGFGENFEALCSAQNVKLSIAVQKVGFSDFTRVLIERFGFPIPDSCMITAVQKEHLSLELLSYLHSHGGSLAAKDSKGHLAHYAAANEKNGLDVLKFLASHGFPLNAKNASGVTPLQKATPNNALFLQAHFQ